MGKRLVSLLLVLIMILTLFSGCGKPKADKSFSAPISDEPTSLDPQIADSDAEKTIVLNCFEGLLRVNEKGELENGVAKSYSVSNDGLTYTFKLRDNAHWALFSGHKELLGEKYNETFDINVYAEDFVFAFDRIFNKQINSPYINMFNCVESYSAPDKHTFVVKLKYADESFLNYLTYPGAMPCDKEFYNLTKGKYGLDARYLLCNGPFNVSKWIEGTSIRIVRNDDYNGENTVKPLAVTFFINPSDAVIAEKMNAGTYDVAYLNKYDYDALSNKDDYDAVGIENTVYSLIFNQSNQYLENKKIRLAIDYAIDLSDIKDLGEDANKAVSIVPPFCRVGNDEYITDNYKSLSHPFNKKKAKEYFEQGLLEIGTSNVELEIKCTQEYEMFMKHIVQKLQKTLGVKFTVTVKIVDYKELPSILHDGNYSIVFYPYTANSVFISDFFEAFSNNNLFGYNSDELKKALNQIHENSGDYKKLKSLCRDAERILVSDAVMIPVIYENSYFITNEDTQGIYSYSSRSNIYFINATKK